MSGLCARCGLNAPLPSDPDDFCQDCIREVDALITDLQATAKRRRAEEYHRLEFACVGVCECGGNPECPRCNP